MPVGCFGASAVSQLDTIIQPQWSTPALLMGNIYLEKSMQVKQQVVIDEHLSRLALYSVKSANVGLCRCNNC